MGIRAFWIALLALTVIASCSVRQPEISARFYVFGTLVDVLVRDTDQATADAAFAEIQQQLQALHRDLHAWEPGPLTRLNQAFSLGRTVTLGGDIPILIEMSRWMEEMTEGRFNAAAGALVALWGFHTSEFPVSSPPPTEYDIRRILMMGPSTFDIHADGQTFSSGNPAVQLDFGGIAKGFAVDRIIALLESRGIDQCMVNAGGDLRAVGGSNRSPWRVGIRGPEGVQVGIELAGRGAVFTSGSSERYLEQEGQRFPHIIDPRTGQPVSGLVSVTVVSDEGWFADAAATALMVAGPDEWQQVAADLGLESVLVIEQDGNVIATQVMAPLLIAEQKVISAIRFVTLPAGRFSEG
ncbi:MAG: FAD:protein FMN transferase [Gammaproteobacteria bacterium]|nr:FAD:protein FMN transferase [Gammaproteobacteria bacterium]